MYPYLGEIRMFAGNYEPAGWKFCEGQLLPISENVELFTLIGTTYGGDGESTFALPDLRGRSPMHQGNGFILAETGGAERVTLTAHQIPAHTHVAMGTTHAGVTADPQGGVWAAWGDNAYAEDVPVGELVPMRPDALTQTGGDMPHENMPPYLAVDFIIALYGVFPSPT
jgi:microcystin-dependent protein